MHPSLQEIQDRFVEKMGFLSSLFGFSKLVGQIYGVLYLSPIPVSLNEMMDHLHVSKGSISTNIRELEKWGGCKKVWVKGDRKDFYEAETNFRSIIRKRLMDALRRRVSIVGEMVDFSKKEPETSSLTPEEKKTLSFYQSRLKKIGKVQSKCETLLNTLGKLI